VKSTRCPCTLTQRLLRKLSSGGWPNGLGLELDENWASAKQRQILGTIFELYAQRGTPAGMRRILNCSPGSMPSSRNRILNAAWWALPTTPKKLL